MSLLDNVAAAARERDRADREARLRHRDIYARAVLSEAGEAVEPPSVAELEAALTALGHSIAGVRQHAAAVHRLLELRSPEYDADLQGERHAALLFESNAKVAELKAAAQAAKQAVVDFERQQFYETECSLARLTRCQGEYQREREQLTEELAALGIVLDLATAGVDQDADTIAGLEPAAEPVPDAVVPEPAAEPAADADVIGHDEDNLTEGEWRP